MCALVTGVQTCALLICLARQARRQLLRAHAVEEDVRADHAAPGVRQHAADLETAVVAAALGDDEFDHGLPTGRREIARASCRGRGCPYVSISVAAVQFTKKTITSESKK